MNAADIVVFPYRDSALTSGAVIMAMGFKKPCIAPKLGAIEDVLDTDGAYFLEAVTDDAVKVTLETAYLERAKLPVMGAHNHAKCMEWSWDAIAEKTVKVYQQCLGGARSASHMVDVALESSNVPPQGVSSDSRA